MADINGPCFSDEHNSSHCIFVPDRNFSFSFQSLALPSSDCKLHLHFDSFKLHYVVAADIPANNFSLHTPGSTHEHLNFKRNQPKSLKE
jgi:hypothetical protein